MPGPAGLQFDRYYHIYNRGVNRCDIFIEKQNYSYFLQLYKQYILPVADTFAYCLLKNYFHLLVRIKTEEEIRKSLRVSETLRDSLPSKQFSDFFNAYAKAINKTYGRSGSLFLHPFGRVEIKGDAQFCQVVAYIHLNPQKHGLIADFRKWRYSSYNSFLSQEATQVQREVVLEWFGGLAGFQIAHQQDVEGDAKWLAASEIET